MQDPTSAIAEHHKRNAETVGGAIDQFIERHQKPRNRSWAEAARILNRELDGWKHRPIQNIRRGDVLALLDQTVDRGSPTMANRLLAHIPTLFNWCIERGLVDASQVARIRARLAPSTHAIGYLPPTSSPPSGALLRCLGGPSAT